MGVILPLVGLMANCEILPSLSLVAYALVPLAAILIASGCSTVCALDAGFGLSAPVLVSMRYSEHSVHPGGIS